MTILTFSGKNIQSLDDIYEGTIEKLGLDKTLFGRNLDALYDVLSDADISKIVISENKSLKNTLQKLHKNNMTEYAALLDVFTDLDVEITIDETISRSLQGE